MKIYVIIEILKHLERISFVDFLRFACSTSDRWTCGTAGVPDFRSGDEWKLGTST